MLRNISVRYKLIILTAIFVGMTGALAALYASWLAYQSAQVNLHSKGLSTAHLYQHVLLDPIRLGDDYRIYELIGAQFKGNQEKPDDLAGHEYSESYLEEVLLLDDSGRVLSTSNPQHIPLNSFIPKDDPVFSATLSQIESIPEGALPVLLDIERAGKFIVLAPLGENGVKYATLLLEYSLEELRADAVRQVRQLVLAIVLITLLMVWLAWFTASRFTSPLLELARSMRQMALRYGRMIGMKKHDSHDEVVQLRDIFSDLERELDVAKRESEWAEERIRHQAEHDALTGLPNRVLLQDRLEQAIARAARKREQLAVMFLDLDHFKRVNDLLGHHAGDELLRLVSQRLLSSVRACDTVCRLGGDEFLLMLAPANEAEALAVADKLIHVIAAPYLLEDGSEINTSPSIGISLYPDGGDTPDTLTKSADEAMYRAKQTGRNNYQLFTPEMHGEVYERASVESQLRQALKQGQFMLHYQPQLELASNRIVGLEALMRWQHPQRGLVYPGDFIHVAEDSGLIIEMGAWVIDEACRQLRAWMDAGEAVPTVAVNVSLRQFHQHDLQTTIEAALQRHDLPGSSLEIELTESVMLREPERVLEVLQNLRARGVRISIDDFGTGYSSLLYLRQLNIDALKMDRSFVMDIMHPQGRAMVKVISDVARVLGLRTVAEGVESAEHLQELRSIGCDEIQGFYFSKPLPPDQVMSLLRRHAGLQ